jgi:hypothetical protein
MKEYIFPLKHFPLVVVLWVCSVAAFAQSRMVTGVVTNGTTGRPASGDDVILLQLGQGMQEQARTKTGAHGEFKLNIADGSTLHLLRVRHDNVNYHEPLQQGTNNLQITVYNAAAKVPGLKLLDQSEVYQANSTDLQVIELFRVSNGSAPPLTQPSFEFYLPEGASIRLGQAVTEGGLPVKAPVVPQKEEKNKYAVLYPLRPGTTQLELAYTIPYNGKATIQPKLAMAADHFYVVTAKGINFVSRSRAQFQQAEQWPTDPSVTGVDVHTINGVTAAQQVSFELSGAGLLPDQQAAATAGSPAAPQPEGDNRPGGGLGVPNEKPAPLHSGQWVFLGVLSLFLAAGATYVYVSNRPAGVQAKKAPDGPGLLLEAMKEEMFQLETDRLQGKISPKEYESARAALDKTLQRAVQRQKSV